MYIYVKAHCESVCCESGKDGSSGATLDTHPCRTDVAEGTVARPLRLMALQREVKCRTVISTVCNITTVITTW